MEGEVMQFAIVIKNVKLKVGMLSQHNETTITMHYAICNYNHIEQPT